MTTKFTWRGLPYGLPRRTHLLMMALAMAFSIGRCLSPRSICGLPMSNLWKVLILNIELNCLYTIHHGQKTSLFRGGLYLIRMQLINANRSPGSRPLGRLTVI